MSSKKTLVTGASGFTGRALCRELAREGRKIVAFVRPTSNVDELKALGVECRTVDLKSPDHVSEGFADIDSVYHLAAAYRTEHSDRDEFRLVNVEGTRNLLEAAAARGVRRFVHCSTVGVQGAIDAPPATEEYRLRPGDHYQETKREGELLAREYFAAGLPGAVVRPVGIYGPGDTRFLKLFRPIQRGYFVMIGSGASLYHMTYISDLIDGMLLVERSEHALGQVFTIAGGEYTTLRELANLIADVLKKPHPRLRVPWYPVYLAAVLCDEICRPFGIKPPLYPRRVEFFKHARAFSTEKAREVLGYEPKVSLPDGLARTAAWYKEKGLL